MSKPLAVLFLLLSPVAHAGHVPARVVGISDGDTLTALTAEKVQAKVRIHGIDAQDFGTQSTKAEAAG